MECQTVQHPFAVRTSSADRCRQRARWAAIALLPMVLLSYVFPATERVVSDASLAIATLISLGLLVHWQWQRRGWRIRLLWPLLSAVAVIGSIVAFMSGYARLATAVAGLLALVLLPGKTLVQESDERWWAPLLNRPARLLISTFLGLCFLGTLLLLLPGATAGNGITTIDAAFTSVSAVCVTGLIVLDTPNVFTPAGQFILLLLIQLGGLGIMTITTVAMHVLGQRLSLRQERLLTEITDTSHLDLVSSLLTIIRFTFVVETVGAFILTGLFRTLGDSYWQAAWRGLFTSVSAFCNAGFALQSDNLIPYQNHPLVLHTVGVLIIFGGLAPAASLMLPRWLAGRTVPLAARIALTTTAVLLLIGAFFFLVVEWNGVLAGLSLVDKLHNAWFQSVTLRTAGFNSVDIAGSSNPVFLVMLCLMFIGGSPGGTAGGIKTTTLGIVAMTFWASIIGRSEVIAQSRRISQVTINRAITIVASGSAILFLVVLMLETTQQVSARELLFEAVSALGTVGLSLGATAHLDGIGKIIIMLAMFIGRVGPITLFMLLSEEHAGSLPRYPDIRISIS